MAHFKNGKLDYRGYGTVEVWEVDPIDEKKEIKLCTIALHEATITITSHLEEGDMKAIQGVDWPETAIVKFEKMIKKGSISDTEKS